MKPIIKIIASTKGKTPVTALPYRVLADGTIRILDTLNTRSTA